MLIGEDCFFFEVGVPFLSQKSSLLDDSEIDQEVTDSSRTVNFSWGAFVGREGNILQGEAIVGGEPALERIGGLHGLLRYKNNKRSEKKREERSSVELVTCPSG